MIPASLVLVALSTAGAALPVARVNEVAIMPAEVAERLALMRSRGAAQAGPREALDNLVGESLLLLEARRLQLQKDPDVAAALEKARRSAAVDAFFQVEVLAGFKPTDEELRRVFGMTADSLRLSVAVFGNEAAAAAAAARVKASGDLAAEIRSAMRTSLAGPDGDTGLRIRGQFDPALSAAAFAAPLEAVAGPVKLETGWAVFKVVERHAADEAAFRARRAGVEQSVRQQALEQARQHLASNLRRAAKVQLDEEFLESLGKRADASPAELEHVLCVINGQPLRYREVALAFRQLSGGAGGHMAGQALRTQLAWSEVDSRLLAAEAARHGYADHALAREHLLAAERRILSGALVERLAAATPAPTEGEVKAFQQSDPGLKDKPFAAVREAISAHLAGQKRAAALDAAVQSLRARAHVDIDQAAMARLEGTK